MKLMTNETKKARNLIELKLAYAIKRMHMHFSTGVHNWDSMLISRKQPKQEP